MGHLCLEGGSCQFSRADRLGYRSSFRGSQTRFGIGRNLLLAAELLIGPSLPLGVWHSVGARNLAQHT
jgi:hypothetical protein